jgi:branched-chain amino acid transport system permease protein
MFERLDLLVDNPTIAFIQFMNGLSRGMVLFVISAGLTMIFGVLRILNFAHGAFYMIGGYAMYSAVRFFADIPGGFWLAAIAASLFMAAIAYVIETLLLRRLYGREMLYQLLFTFALVLLLVDFVRAIWGAQLYRVPYPRELMGPVNLGISAYPAYLLFLIIFGAVAALVLALVVNRTRIGRLTRAATQDPEMLAALGINVRAIFTGVFVFGAFLAGLGGALSAPRSGLDLSMHATIIVEAFIVTIVGGLGSLWGALLGALIIGQVAVFGAVLFPELEIVLVYLVMVVVLILRPWGLLGSPPAVRA